MELPEKLAALVPCHVETLPTGRYRVVYEAPLPPVASANRQDEVARLTREITARIEAWVRANPEQWLWMHRRWKTQPSADEPPRRSTLGNEGRAVNSRMNGG